MLRRESVIHRSAASVAIVGIVALALAWAMRVPPPLVVAPAPPPADGPGAPMPANPTPPVVERAAVQALLQPGRGSYFVTDQDQQPLPGVQLHALRRGSGNASGAPIAVSSAAGWIELPSGFGLAPDHDLLFWLEGFAPSVLAEHEGGHVILMAAQRLAGSAVDRDGRVVAGLRCVVSRVSTTMGRAERLGPPAGTAESVHSAVSDERGEFVVTGLGAGAYRVWFEHAILAVVDAGLGVGETVTLPCAKILVRLGEIHRACVKVRGLRIASVNLRLPDGRSAGPLALRSVEYALTKQGLHNGWNADGATYYALPGLGTSAEVAPARMTLYFADAPPHPLDALFRPMRDDHVQWVEASASRLPSAHVTLRVEDVSSQALPGLDVTLMRFHEVRGDSVSEAHALIQAAEVELPCGEFEISLMDPILSRVPRDGAARVTLEAGPQEVRIRFREQLTRVRVHCPDLSLGDCMVKVDAAAGGWSSRSVRNGTPPEFWLPHGSYQVGVSRTGLRGAATRFTVTGTDRMQEVHVAKLVP